MKRYPVLMFLAALAFALAGPLPSYADETVDTVDRMAAEVLKYFPRAEGHVTYAEGQKIKVDIGLKDGVKAGTDVFLFRPGKPIRHPVTKAVLGNREEPLGKMTVTEAGDREAVGEIKELLVTQVIPGDVARLSTDKTRLLFGTCGKDYNELAVGRLFGLLRDSGRFDVLGTEDLPKDPMPDTQSAGKLLAGRDAWGLVAIRTTPTKRQDRTKVEVALYGKDGAVIERQGGEVDVTSGVYTEKSMEYPLVRGEHRDFFHVENLPYRARHMAAGNITGDGRTELAVSDGRAITVYRLEGGAMKELWREEGQAENEHLDVECADLNGNGKDEIYVTNFVRNHLESYVIEYDGASFKRICGQKPLFFRVLDVPGSGKKLITTTIGKDAPYSGIIKEFRWEGGLLVDKGRFPLPRKIKDPYGFVLMDLVTGKDKPAPGAPRPAPGHQIVWVDDSDYIQVLDSKGKKLWKSPERYGGYDNFFEMDQKDLALAGTDPRGKIKGRLIVRDGPEGGKEIVLTKNLTVINMLRRLKGYSGAEIYSFAWEGGALVNRWSIKNIEGYLADIYIGGVTNSGREEIAIISDPTFKWVKASKSLPIGSLASVKDTFADRSSLLIYKIPQR
jgi:outer membrane protein assembly factor BamB